MGVGDAYFLGRTSKIKIDQAAFSLVYYGIMNICNIYLKFAPIPCVEAITYNNNYQYRGGCIGSPT